MFGKTITLGSSFMMRMSSEPMTSLYTMIFIFRRFSRSSDAKTFSKKYRFQVNGKETTMKFYNALLQENVKEHNVVGFKMSLIK